jgi:carbon storage regulator CsrA
MLVLTRKVDGELVLTHEQTGEEIRIMVCDIRGGRIRLGIELPKSWNVRRGELPPAEAPKAQTLPRLLEEAKAGPVDVEASLRSFFADRPA